MSARHAPGLALVALLLLAAPAHAQSLPGIVPGDEVVGSLELLMAYLGALRAAVEKDAGLVLDAGGALADGALGQLGPLGRLLQYLADAFTGAARDVADRGASGTCAEATGLRPALDPAGAWAGAAQACADLAAEVEGSHSGIPWEAFP